MKKLIAVAAAVLGLLIGLPASAGPIFGFTGPYAPGTWTVAVLGNLIGALGGSAVMTATTLTLTGGDAVSPDPANFAPACAGATYSVRGPCEIDIFTTHIENPFTFSWAYTTHDSAGPAGDIFGIIVNGVRIVLSDPGGAINQSGNLTVLANTSFGWFINCTDCIEGAAIATITNFVAGAPEPGSLALLGLGLASLCVMRRRIA